VQKIIFKKIGFHGIVTCFASEGKKLLKAFANNIYLHQCNHNSCKLHFIIPKILIEVMAPKGDKREHDE